jgi:hypothetical protein
MNSETSDVRFKAVWSLYPDKSEQNSSPAGFHFHPSPAPSALWSGPPTAAASACDYPPPGWEAHAMDDSNDPRDDQKRELQCLRLASDLRQLAKQTLKPDLKAHCLRMAKQWSDEADEPAKDDTGVVRGLVH